jgi:hypothetical protein
LLPLIMPAFAGRTLVRTNLPSTSDLAIVHEFNVFAALSL